MSKFEELLFSMLPDEFMEKMTSFEKHGVLLSARDFNGFILRDKIFDYKPSLEILNFESHDFQFGFKKIIPGTFLRKYPVLESYLGAATLKGYQSFSVSRTSFFVTLISSLFLEDIFDEDEDEVFYFCLCAINLLAYFFYFQIKTFPSPYSKNGYNWYFQFFLDFFSKVLKKVYPMYTDQFFESLKNKLVDHYDVFSFLFVYYYRISKMLSVTTVTDKVVQDFSCKVGFFSREEKNYFTEKWKELGKTKKDPHFFEIEEELLGVFGPYDLMIKNLINNVKTKLFVRTFVATIYDKKVMHDFMKNFSKRGGDVFFLDLVDIVPFQKSFLVGVREYIYALFRSVETTREEEEMFEEFQDKLEEFDGDLEKLKDMNIKIPKRIRQESALFDQFLDFYIELIGEQHIKNTDTGSFRLFSAPFFHTFAVHCIDGMLTTSTPELRKEFFSDLVDDYAFLRKFFEEMEAQMKKQKSPSNGVQLAELNLFSFYQLLFKWQAVVFQDFLEQDREKNSDSRFWKWLKKRYGEIISKETSGTTEELLSFYFRSVLSSSLANHIVGNYPLENLFLKHQLVNMKNALYSLEFWIYRSALSKFAKIQNSESSNPFIELRACADLRKVVFGMVFFGYFLKTKGYLDEYSLYFSGVLRSFYGGFFKEDQDKNGYCSAFLELIEEFSEPLSYLLEQKENQDFLQLLWDLFLQSPEVLEESSGYLWYQTAFSLVAYYNRTLLLPF